MDSYFFSLVKGIRNINLLLTFKKIIAIYSEKNGKPENTLWG